jgi:N-acyl homoserine lactone hydrolase
MTRRRRILIVSAIAFAAVLVLAVRGCALTSHPTQASSLGAPRSSADLLAVIDVPGELELETVNSADWAVDRSGLINLDHPTAKAAGLMDGDEPIQVYFHAIRHPTRGLFIVDTGIEKAMRDAPDQAALRGLIAKAMHAERMKFNHPLGEWLAAQSKPLAGVFLTHLHADHISGMRDVRKGAGIYAGPHEAHARSLVNLILSGPTNDAFAGQAPISEWQFQPDPAGRFAGVIDVFGDGQLWALSVPGHTPGSTAYLARTEGGPVLMTGDTCHTAWGWEHDVEPGSFTEDRARNVESLSKLRALVKEHPTISVRLGHQSLAARER